MISRVVAASMVFDIHERNNVAYFTKRFIVLKFLISTQRAPAPPVIAYEYNHVVEPNSNEAKLVEILKQPRDWVQ